MVSDLRFLDTLALRLIHLTSPALLTRNGPLETLTRESTGSQSLRLSLRFRVWE